MRKRGRKFLLILGVIVVVIGAVFILFHDSTDLDKVEKEQVESSEKAQEEGFDQLNGSFEE